MKKVLEYIEYSQAISYERFWVNEVHLKLEKNGQNHVQKDFCASYKFYRQIENNMKLVSWNVNGIVPASPRALKKAFMKLDADIFCLQETKCQENQVKLELPGYYQYWNYANRKGYSGTAVFTKKSRCP